MTTRGLAVAATALLLCAPLARGEAELEPALSAPEPEAAAPATAEPGAAPAASDRRVVRAGFTTDVIDREPQGWVTALENDHLRVFYFSELRGMQGRSVTHRWEYAGSVVAEVSFEVSGPRWRVYSVKSLGPEQLGEWSVTLVDDAGHALRRDVLRYAAVVEDADPEIPGRAPQP